MTQPKQQADRQLRRWRARPESWWWISAVVLIPVVALTSLAALVLIAATHPTTAVDQIDLVKTALSVGAGTGGVVALVLASRRQWHAEEAQRDTEQSHRAAEHDAAERRITDLYTKASDQLGSDKAPVRLAGLYALERLAQKNPDQRQIAVNVICAYLRMPYTPPISLIPDREIEVLEQITGDTPHNTRWPNGSIHPEDELQSQDNEKIEQELQVRLTAQSILIAHLHLEKKPSTQQGSYWSDIALDLTNATLVDFDLSFCQLTSGSFKRATFIGHAHFERAQFDSIASFYGAQFTDHADFRGVHFTDHAWFDHAAFFEYSDFTGSEFAQRADFVGVDFNKVADFSDVRFSGRAHFMFTTFNSGTAFFETKFGGETRFDDVSFEFPGELEGALVRPMMHLSHISGRKGT